MKRAFTEVGNAFIFVFTRRFSSYRVVEFPAELSLLRRSGRLHLHDVRLGTPSSGCESSLVYLLSRGRISFPYLVQRCAIRAPVVPGTPVVCLTSSGRPDGDDVSVLPSILLYARIRWHTESHRACSTVSVAAVAPLSLLVLLPQVYRVYVSGTDVIYNPTSTDTHRVTPKSR